jgi:beta-glucosidase
VDAIVQAWYPGQRGGTALARILFGLTNPSGRLPVTVYRSATDLPDFENYSMDGRTYRYYRGEPLFAFGHGLSYSSFRYDDLRVSDGEAGGADSVRLSVRVTNTGNAGSYEVVQAYVNKPADDRTNRSLCAFSKVFIPAGGTLDVEMIVAPEQLRSFDEGAGVLRVQPEEYRIGVGSSSGDIRLESDFSVH